MTNKNLQKLSRTQRIKLQGCLEQSGGVDQAVYAVIDAAKDSSIPYFLSGLKADYRCLFQGEKAKSLANVAPYIVKLEKVPNTVNWYLEKLYGSGVGFVIKSRSTLDDLADFWGRKVLTEIPDSNVKGYFRYYDPIVLREYLVLLRKDNQLSDFLGCASTLLLEEEEQDRLARYSRLSVDGNEFSYETISLASKERSST